MKITLDTNVLISALITSGKSRRLLLAIIRRGHEVILSKGILAEFAEISDDPRIRRYVSEQDVARFLRNLSTVSRIILLKSKFHIVPEDPDDDVILRTAHDGKARYLVSGDSHLLKLKRYRRIRIVTVGQMMRYVGEKDDSPGPNDRAEHGAKSLRPTQVGEP